jgi:hypothetical protein
VRKSDEGDGLPEIGHDDGALGDEEPVDDVILDGSVGHT